jgi:glycosyltransferase involved in cell wall biosynthesis
VKKKIFVKGPVLSQSGYGVQSRFALRALRAHEDRFEIYIHPITWGETGWIWEDDDFRNWMDERITQTAILSQQKVLAPEISLQITIPNEWEKMCQINIGYTAGIETTNVSPQWLVKGNDMDKVLVVSEHAKRAFVETTAAAKNNQTGEEVPYKIETPIEVVHENSVICDPTPIEGFDLANKFNFLMVSQMGPRKNMENAVRWWVEEFIDQDVGLVVKTHFRGSSVIDREATYNYFEKLLADYKDRKCKVHVLHGDLSDAQMSWLYRHDKIKCLVNIAHGEGFGLPLYEAAMASLPIITIGWSGQKDILEHGGKQYFTGVNYGLQPIQKEAEWKGVLEPGTQWAFADQGSYKMALRKVKKKWKAAKKLADELQPLVAEKFNNEKLYENFCNAVYEPDPEVEEWLSELEEMVELD